MPLSLCCQFSLLFILHSAIFLSMPKSVARKQKPIIIENVCVIRYLPQKDKWDLDAGLKLGGTKKYRKRFKCLEEAKQHAELLRVKLHNQGTSAFSLSQEDRVDAERALKALKETKFSTLLQAVEFANRYAGQKLSDITISELVHEFRQKKEEEKARDLRGASEATLQEYKYRNGMLAAHFGGMLVREFTESDFKPLFASKNFSPNLLSKTKTLFNYAVKEGIIPENPIKIDPPKKKTTQPKVFGDSDWRKLVLTAIHSQEHRFSKGEPIDLLAYVVLGLWCGLRPKAELERLSWDDVHLDDEKPQIFIHPDWKVKHSRWVDIPSCAVGLLRMCINREGRVVKPKNLRRRLDWLKESAGVKSVWSPDIMRHTFASMHYGRNNDKAEIAKQLGHVGQGILDHYVNNGKNMKARAREFYAFEASLQPEPEVRLTGVA